MNSNRNLNNSADKFRILLVEDHRAIREVAEATLRMIGPFEVESTYDAHKAVEMALRGQYDAILMDLRLPDMRGKSKAGEMLGIQAMSRIREFSDVPIIVTTAYGDAKTQRAAMAAGATMFKSKPIDWMELAGKLIRLIERKSTNGQSLATYFGGVPQVGRVPTAFCSYADQDTEFLLRLDTYLRPLERQNVLTLWHNQDIQPGTDRGVELHDHLANADLILPLVSPDYLGCDICFAERQIAMQQHGRGESVVVPVLIRAADWRHGNFGFLAPLPTNHRPVNAWSNRDEAWLQIVEGIRFVAERLKGGRDD